MVATLVECLSPCLPATPVLVSVSNSGPPDTDPSALTFDVLPLPSVASLSPSAGPLLGGAKVTVAGAEFTPSAQLSCAFGSRVVPAKFHSASQITCRAPSGSAGVARVSM
ncbi:hypothetical protein T484DRAFT_1869618 [Baffinella frigidus]|nr:hypothetical protein T484DRAFT_1869618 [Cryptophyta sp. CCMP2293]